MALLIMVTIFSAQHGYNDHNVHTPFFGRTQSSDNRSGPNVVTPHPPPSPASGVQTSGQSRDSDWITELLQIQLILSYKIGFI